MERDHQLDLASISRGSFSRSIGVVPAGGKADAVTMAHLDSMVKRHTGLLNSGNRESNTKYESQPRRRPQTQRKSVGGSLG